MISERIATAPCPARQGRMRRAWTVLPVGLLLVGTGCASLQQPKITEMVWPGPPLAPRIRFESMLRNSRDLQRSSGDFFKEALFGMRRLPDSLTQPMGVAPSRDGTRLYVTDYVKPRVVVFDFKTQRVSNLGAEPYGLKAPFGVAVDDQDAVYVADSLLRLVRVFDADGKFLRDITHESLERPTGIAIDAARHRLYVADSSRSKSEHHAILLFDLNGTYQRAIGKQGSQPGEFFFPTYLTVDPAGNLYVTDTLNGRLQVFNAEGAYLKTIGERGDAYGMFDKPKGVALDAFGNVYVADSGWSNVQIFNQRGEVLLFFGGRGHFPGLLFNPTGIAIDRNNRIYVADAFNGRVGIYQLVNTTAKDSLERPAEPGAVASMETTVAQIPQQPVNTEGGE